MPHPEEQSYELAYWFKADQDTQQKLDFVIAMLQEYEAKVETANLPKRMRMAYPVKKQKEGYFGFIRFSMPNNENLAVLRKKLDLQDYILRAGIFVKDLRMKEISMRTAAKLQKAPAPTKTLVESSADVNVEELEKRLEEILKPTT